MNLSFNTPKTATVKEYVISGTLPANATIDGVVEILVTRSDNSTQGYYIAQQYAPYTVDTFVTDTVLMPVLPQLVGTDTITSATTAKDIEGWIIQ